ncbi:ABC transporter substrate-binding protein [Devosia limi DSM 17137]|uniref:ABC transporter substrate-binding protein n=1 Tax=Devosia limi DSM 17137 TaxID=1121477 RepID=A0A0F5LE63_9HYPH|nr:ABC transporter substrate-binding protein [Devosia limi]KKB80671.1 ABC transporter substrate-binding protein [Devosia limi DSM 17137]SHE48679.1 branched-chain amino acid transport system substrate-binding protein [Devosia limi DSM 17137]
MNLKLIVLGGAMVAGLQVGTATTASAQDCQVSIGAVLSITGSMAAIGSAIGDAGQLAVDQFNEAGGVNGCQIRYVLRDDQGSPNVGVDAAKTLVEIENVPVVLGAIQSGVSLPVLTSVTVPAKVTQISCCSSAPSFTDLAASGGTDGYWFRTLPTDRPQAVVMANIAREKGYKNIAVIYVNSDYGVSLSRQFKAATEALGGQVASMTAYNQEQASYRAEVNSALQGEPDALFLIAFPADGATAAREWISFGGTQNMLLSNALRADEFVDAVGAQYLSNAVGIDNAQVEGPSVDAFNTAWSAKFGSAPNGPGLHTMYDAAAVALLAMEQGGEANGTVVRDSIRLITGGEGEVVNPGVEGFKRAKELIAQGKPVRYVGATGPITFDANGDVTGPYLIWGVKDDALTTLDTWDSARVDAAIAEIDG